MMQNQTLGNLNGVASKASPPPASRPCIAAVNHPAAQPVLALRDIQVVYPQGQIALDIPGLEFQAGHNYAVVGENGAGKSTLFKVLTRLIPPQRGQLLWRGQDVLHTRACSPKRLRQHVVLVHQQPVMFRTTVFRNVAYGLKLRRVPRLEMARRVEAALSWVGMETHAARPARSLSGGEAQRVALARALVIEPEVVLLDEPTANLDSQSCAIIEDLIQALKVKYGRTVLFTTHDLAQAYRLSDHLIALSQGRLVEPPLTHSNPHAVAPPDAPPDRLHGRLR